MSTIDCDGNCVERKKKINCPNAQLAVGGRVLHNECPSSWCEFSNSLVIFSLLSSVPSVWISGKVLVSQCRNLSLNEFFEFFSIKWNMHRTKTNHTFERRTICVKILIRAKRIICELTRNHGLPLAPCLSSFAYLQPIDFALPKKNVPKMILFYRNDFHAAVRFKSD